MSPTDALKARSRMDSMRPTNSVRSSLIRVGAKDDIWWKRFYGFRERVEIQMLS